jgi:hypothetical protein
MLDDINSGEDLQGAKQGQESLRIYYDEWSSAVGNLGVHVTYAIIAAIWAVYSGTDEILANPYALISIGICVFFLALNLLLSEIMTEWLRVRWQKAEDNKKWWIEEYKRRNETQWPYTKGIEQLGRWLRYMKTVAPVAAGASFIVSLLLR